MKKVTAIIPVDVPAQMDVPIAVPLIGGGIIIIALIIFLIALLHKGSPLRRHLNLMAEVRKGAVAGASIFLTALLVLGLTWLWLANSHHGG